MATAVEIPCVGADAIHGAAQACETPATKRCTRCGHEKPRTEFYVHRVLKNGNVICQPACKECSKTAAARRRATRRGVHYLPRQKMETCCRRCGQAVAQHTDGVCRRCCPIQSARQREEHEWKREGTWEWRKALRAATVRAACRQANLYAARDPWYRRFASAISGIRNRVHALHRRVDKPKQRRSLPSVEEVNWAQAIRRATAARKSRTQQIRMLQQPWFKKFTTMTRNWRRKAFGR